MINRDTLLCIPWRVALQLRQSAFITICMTSWD